jgi:programmed cell death 6-interacting protein
MMLEDLDDARAHRARLVAEAKRVAAKDDIRPQVLEMTTKLAQGGSGGAVKPEIFEDLFDKELRKYRRLADEMQDHIRQQERSLEILEVSSGFDLLWQSL